MRGLPMLMVLSSIILLCGCGDATSIFSSRSKAPLASFGKAKPDERFRISHGIIRLSSGKDIPIMLRMNIDTGETWLLSADGNQWVGVEDDVRRSGKWNPEKKTIEWGVKVPDGRDLNELSKDELMRYLSAAIRNGKKLNESDPLEIREGGRQQ